MHTFTVHDLLRKNVVERPAEVCLLLADAELTYGELRHRAARLAATLARLGVGRHDRVVIHLPKSFEELVATFAVAQLGAVFVNVHAQWTARQLDYVIADAGARVVITDSRRATQLLSRTWPASVKHVIVHGDCPDDARMTPWSSPDAPLEAPCPAIDQDLAAILYTSGSTGAPKGVMFTHLNIVEGARAVSSYLKNTAADRALSLLPLCFDYGLNQITTMFLVGGKVVLQPVPMPAEIVATIVRHKVTGFAAVPPVWIQVARYLVAQPTSFPALRYITNSGGAIPSSVLEVLPRLFPDAEIFLMYGLTEAFRSTFLPPEHFSTHMGSIGKAIPNVEIFVVDAEKGICGPGEQGELLHRGSLVSRGYWGKPEATSEKIKPCPHLAHLIGDEKVCYSGDVVRRDADGFLWFVGRRDEMIKCSGFRLSPTEVEDIVHQSGLVEHCVAYGVRHEELGQVVHIVVTWTRAEDVTALTNHCRSSMPTYMVPHAIHTFEGPMPRTASGKLDRPKIVASAREK